MLYPVTRRHGVLLVPFFYLACLVQLRSDVGAHFVPLSAAFTLFQVFEVSIIILSSGVWRNLTSNHFVPVYVIPWHELWKGISNSHEGEQATFSGIIVCFLQRVDAKQLGWLLTTLCSQWAGLKSLHCSISVSGQHKNAHVISFLQLCKLAYPFICWRKDSPHSVCFGLVGTKCGWHVSKMMMCKMFLKEALKLWWKAEKLQTSHWNCSHRPVAWINYDFTKLGGLHLPM